MQAQSFKIARSPMLAHSDYINKKQSIQDAQYVPIETIFYCTM
jgi:hypothetical protein